jgi:6-pyruvoyltetrahydropterin/6-carboxytetrahydropterin synthase
MLIERRYRFYAAHRNVGLGGKCSRLHGHRYGIEVVLKVERGPHGVGIKFEDIDAKLAPVFESFDHRALLHDKDELAHKGIDGAIVFPFEPSTERLAAYLLQLCRFAIPEVVSLSVTETDSATVTATEEDIIPWLTQ